MIEHPSNRCNCHVSTGIDDILTFGTGQLDDNGFWEHSCDHHVKDDPSCVCVYCKLARRREER